MPDKVEKPQSEAPAPKPAEQTKKKLETKHVILISVIIIAIAAVIIAYLLTRSDVVKDEPVPTAILNEENLSEITDGVREKVAKGMFTTYMNTVWTFPDGKSPSSNAVMGNSHSNNYAFWFTVTLAEEDEDDSSVAKKDPNKPGPGDIVYTSVMMPVGSKLEEIILDEDLDAGEYSAYITIHMVDENDEEVDGNMGINLTLLVEN